MEVSDLPDLIKAAFIKRQQKGQVKRKSAQALDLQRCRQEGQALQRSRHR